MLEIHAIRREDLLTAFSLSADLLLRSRLYALAGHNVQQKRNTIGGAVNRRSPKNAFSEAASIFGLRQPLRGLKGASSPFLVDPARRNRWWFSGSLLTSKENISLNERALYPRAPAREAGVFLVLFWHAKENLAPMQKRSTPAPPARENALRHIRNAPQSPLRFHRAS